VIYEPSLTYSASYDVTFSCKVNDGALDSLNKEIVHIDVAADNDAPYVGSDYSIDPNSTFSMDEEDAPLVITLDSGSDPEGGSLIYRIASLPSVGELHQYINSGDHKGVLISTTPAEV
jgi:hypothetical protein